MPKRIALFMLLVIASHLQAQTVMPDQIANIEMSNRDINRVVCTDGAINDAFFSQEKGIVLENSGRNSFVKFLINESGSDMEYVETRSEFYITCNNEIYTLMVTPTNIPGQTIRLSTGTRGRIEENQALLSPLPDEERAVYLTLAALHDDIPDSFTLEPSDESAWIQGLVSDQAVQISKRRQIRVDGMGMTLKEYLVRVDRRRTFEETAFLSNKLGDSILAVTVDPLELRPGQVGRLFIVEKEGF